MTKQYLCALLGMSLLAACPVTGEEEKNAQGASNTSDEQGSVHDDEDDLDEENGADEEDPEIVSEKDPLIDPSAPAPMEKPITLDASVEKPLDEDAGMPEEEPEIPEEDAGALEEEEEEEEEEVDAGTPVIDPKPVEEPTCKPIPLSAFAPNSPYNWSLGGWPMANLTLEEMSAGVCYDTGGCTTQVGLAMANLTMDNVYYANLRGQVHGCREYMATMTEAELKDFGLDLFTCLNRGYTYWGANFSHNGYTWLASRWPEPEPGATNECMTCIVDYVDCSDPCFEKECSAVSLTNVTPACLSCMERCMAPARKCTKLNFSKL